MKKTKKTALIVAMAAVTGTTIESKAMQAAIADMQAEYGRENICVDYTWDPFDGMFV